MSEARSNHVAVIKRYLKSREDSEIVYRGYPFVTFSRQSGVGAHVLARTILEEMDRVEDHEPFRGWEMFDQTVCALVAQDKDLNGYFETLVSEEYRSEIHQYVYEMIIGKSEQYEAYKRIFEVVRILGTIGKALIIGRGSSYVTSDMPNGIHIRLIASEPWRLKNMLTELDTTSEKEARKVMYNRDRDRERLVKDFFTKDINDPLNYAAIFNVEHYDTQHLARIIIGMIREKAEQLRA